MKGFRLALLATLMVALLGMGLAQKKVLQVVWFTEGSGEAAIFEKFLKEYKDQNPDVDFAITYVPFQELTKKLQLLVAGGTPPAMARVVTANIAEFDGAALDLARYTDGKAFLAQFLPSQLPYVRRGARVIGAPIDVTANGLFYNKTCFQQAGVSVPTGPDNVWTWAEWVAALKKVTQSSSCRFGLAYDYTTHRWSTLLYGAGGRFVSEDGQRMAINRTAGIRTVLFFAGLFEQGLIPKSIWLSGENPNALFRSGLVAMHMSGNWNLNEYAQIKNFEWGVTYLPKDKIRSTVPGGKFIMGFKDSRYPEETARFIQWFTSREVNHRFSRENLFLSARKDGKEVEYPRFNDAFKIYLSDLGVTPEYVGADWANPAMARLNTYIRDQLVQAILGKQTPAQTVSNIEQEGNRVLKELQAR